MMKEPLMKEPLSVKIYAFHYKNGMALKNDEIYQPIMAGNALLSGQKDFIGDDTGNHISEKNKTYSELTGIYWVWKNTTQDIVGSMHYRRFLTRKPEPFFYKIIRLLYFPLNLYRKRYGLIYTGNYKLFRHRILSKGEILEILKDYDAILPVKRRLPYSVREHYRRYHNLNDLQVIESILREKYPEYLSSFKNFLDGNRMYANNMFVMKRTDFDRCMEWLFSVLFDFESKILPKNYSGYQERICGFMGERLLNVWLLNQRLKIKELPVIYFKKLKKI